MKGPLHLLFSYASASARSQMQYKTSFIMGTLGNLLFAAIEVVAIMALFARFGNIRGWTLPEIALLYGMANMSFSLADALARGFDVFPYRLIRTGGFDWLLLRPQPTALQVVGLEIRARSAGRFLQGAVVLCWALANLDIAWRVSKVILLASSIAGGTCLFAGIFVLQGTVSFWTVESLEMINVLTWGGVDTAQYPLSVYRGWFRAFFTYVVPLACLNYFPSLAILGRADPTGTPAIIQWLSPLFGLLFLAIMLQVWEFGVRHYRSTGS